MPTIEQRGKHSWRIGEKVKQPDGSFEWVRRNISYPKDMPQNEQEKKIQLAMAQLLIDIDAGKIVRPEGYTVRTFSDLWMEEYVRPSTSPNNVKTMAHMLEKHILPALGDVKLEKLTPLMLQKFLNQLRATPKDSTTLPPDQRKRKPTQAEIDAYAEKVKQQQAAPEYLSERTVLHYYNALNTMLEKAVQWEKLAANPMAKVDRPKKVKRKMNFLDDAQAVQLLAKLANEENMSMRAAILLALTCGLRLGEVGGLYFADIDWQHGTIDVQRALKYTPEKGNFLGDPKSETSQRLISLPPALLVLLDETRKFHAQLAELMGDRWRGDGRIVCSWDGSPIHHDTPSKWWRKFADANGFEGLRFHELRHSHATLLLANNVDAVAVASRLGHSDAATTLREYAHALRKRDEASAKVMQQLFSASEQSAVDVERLTTLHPKISIRTINSQRNEK